MRTPCSLLDQLPPADWMLSQPFARQETSEGHLEQASKVTLLFLFKQVWEVRMQRALQDFKGHNEPVTTSAWHPKHEDLFVSGAQDGSITHWLVSQLECQVGLI